MAPGMDAAQLNAWVIARFADDPQAQGPFWHTEQPVWLPVAGELQGAYAVEYSQGITVLRSLIDAQSLEVLSTTDLGVYHHAAEGPDSVACTGKIFSPDPLTATAATYGGSYQDDNDGDNAVLTAARVQVPLLGLAFNGNNYLLEGPYVRISDLENPSIAPVMSSTGSFDYTRNQSGFEDVMVYYHIDMYQRYLQSIGFTNLYDTVLNADPHGLSNQDNSHFIPQGFNSRVAFGEGGVDDAEDADVILHEYGHALSYSALQGGNSGQERLGLDEGIGDYIAASYSRSVSYNLWKNTFTWDGHNEFWSGRSASTSQLYPPNTTNIYTYGEIWATALMEVYGQIGRTASDRVIFQSLYSNAANLSLVDAAYIVLDADSLLYGGAHVQQYKNAFCARGILTGTAAGQACAVGRSEASMPALSVQVYPNPTSGQVTVSVDAPVGTLSWQLRDCLGRQVRTAQQNGTQFSVELGDMGAGIYFLEIVAKGFAPTVQRVELLPR
jgi:zinc metalloprotease ZmpB